MIASGGDVLEQTCDPRPGTTYGYLLFLNADSQLEQCSPRDLPYLFRVGAPARRDQLQAQRQQGRRRWLVSMLDHRHQRSYVPCGED